MTRCYSLTSTDNFITEITTGKASLPTIQTIEEALAAKIPEHRELVQHLRKDYGDQTIGTCTLKQAYGGMRGVTSMTYETSDVDPHNGVRIRDIPILECLRVLPKPPGGAHPYVEGMFWLLLTGNVPSEMQLDAFRKELAALPQVPAPVFRVLDALPVDMHPMAQLSIALLALQPQSEMASTYSQGTPRDQLWKTCLRDVLTVVVQQPVLAAYIYRRMETGGRLGKLKSDLGRWDFAQNFVRLMGFNDPVLDELSRLHLCTHIDHGGGSASCFGVRVVGSTLSDPFMAWSAGVNGLAGPLHGRANEEVMRFLRKLQAFLDGRAPSRNLLRAFFQRTLDGGGVIPGYGHTTLLATDPRFYLQRAFAREFMADDPMCALVDALFHVVPDVLREQGKVRNPWPNVDAHSGVLMHNRGLTRLDFHAVLFATSRVMGPLANLVWDHISCLPVVRTMSVTTRWLSAQFDGDDKYVPPGLPQLLETA